MKIELPLDWSEFLCSLIAHRVRFVIVGGHAVAMHGEPRFTEDLDVFVQPSLANARRLRKALVDFGFGAVAPAVEDLARPDKVLMLGRKPQRIDILTGIDGVSFAAAWASRVEADFERRPLYVIGRAALMRNKRAAGREKDLGDLALLEAHAPRAKRRPRTKKRSAR
ncbi:MAG TPA: nucleotidyl transferase AbiEii/AbiGii toxin family protein [Labilithrix sp.]